MNVKQTINISTNIHDERIKTKYIPSYIFENEGKMLWSVSIKTRTFASVNTCNGSF